MRSRALGAFLLITVGVVLGAIALRSDIAQATGLGRQANGKIAFIAGWRTNSTPVFRIDTISPDGSGRQTLTSCKTARHCAYGQFAWSPDGKRLAFQRGYGVCCLPEGKRANVPLFVVNADGSGEKRLPGCGIPWPSCGSFTWSPDSGRIAFTRSGSLYVVDTRSGPPVRITHSLVCCESVPRWSPDGSTLLLGTSLGVYRVRADGTGLAKLADGSSPSWSPDGRRIAFSAGNSIATMDADGSHVTPLFSAGNRPKGTSPDFPVWSPDGTQIAFGRTPDTTPNKPGGFVAEIWTMWADGTHPRRLYRSGITGPVPVWSPDGRFIAFADAAGNGIYLVRSTGEPRLRLLTRAAAGFAWQPIRTNG